MTVASQNGSKQPKLLERVRIAIRTKHYSYSTEKTYIHWVRKYILFRGNAAQEGCLKSMVADLFVFAIAMMRSGNLKLRALSW